MIKVRKSFVIIGILSFIYAILSGGNLPYSIFYTLLLISLFMGIYIYIIGKNLRVVVDCSEYSMIAGNKNKISINIYNYSIFPILYLEIKNLLLEDVTKEENDNVITLELDSKKILTKDFQPSIRGYYSIGRIICNISDIFGVFNYNKQFNIQKLIKVYPRTYDINIKEFNINSLIETNNENIKVKGGESKGAETITDVRKYRYGDSYRRINWKATAKYGELFVKEYNDIERKGVYVFLDLRKDKFIFDYEGIKEEALVEFFLSFIKNIIYQNIICNVVIINETIKELSVYDYREYEILVDYMIKSFSSGGGNLNEYIDKYLQDKNTENSVIIVGYDNSDEVVSCLVNLRNKGYKANLFYLKNYENEDNYKSNLLGCYNIREFR